MAKKEKSKEVKQWITIKGKHIPVYKGETVDDAAKNFMKHEGTEKKSMSRREKLDERQQKYNEMEDILGESFDPDLVGEIEKDWNAFYKDPKKYKGTVVPELVNHYIDQHPITKGAYDKAYRKAHKDTEVTRKEDKTGQESKKSEPTFLSYDEMVAKYGQEAVDAAGMPRPDKYANKGMAKEAMEKYKGSKNYQDQKLAKYQQDVAKQKEKDKQLAMDILAKAGVGDLAPEDLKKSRRNKTKEVTEAIKGKTTKQDSISNAKYADDEHHPTEMGKVKKGDFFKLSNKPNAKVYVRDEYDKSEKAYWCYEYEDVNNGRYMKKNKTVYTGFTY